MDFDNETIKTIIEKDLLKKNDVFFIDFDLKDKFIEKDKISFVFFPSSLRFTIFYKLNSILYESSFKFYFDFEGNPSNHVIGDLIVNNFDFNFHFDFENEKEFFENNEFKRNECKDMISFITKRVIDFIKKDKHFRMHLLLGDKEVSFFDFLRNVSIELGSSFNS